MLKILLLSSKIIECVLCQRTAIVYNYGSAQFLYPTIRAPPVFEF